MPCSAAKTPNWQVNDDATRIIVKIVAYGRFSSVGSGGHLGGRARAVKYMANRPAKNISSLESQMIVPTLTMFGRVKECTRDVSKVLLATGAVVTGVIMASAGVVRPRVRWAWRQSDQLFTVAPAYRGTGGRH